MSVDYKHFDISKFRAKEITTTTYKGKDGPDGTNQAINLVYDYTDYSKFPGKTLEQIPAKDQRVSRLKIRLPEMETSGTGVSQGKFNTYEMMVFMDKNKPEMTRVMEVLDQIFQQCLTAIEINQKALALKGPMGPDKKPTKWTPEMWNGEPRQLYHVPQPDDEGKIDPSKSPSMWLSINTNMEPQVDKNGKKYYNYSLFTSPGGTEYSYKDLANCKLQIGRAHV